MKKFSDGYGSSLNIPSKAMEVDPEIPIPTDFTTFLAHLKKIILWSCATLSVSALLLSPPRVQRWLSSEYSQFLTPSNLPFLKSLCPSTFNLTVGAWHSLALALGVICMATSIAIFPYSTALPMCNRIRGYRPLLLLALSLIFSSILLYFLLINPLSRCSQGQIVSGHGVLIIDLMTTTPLGLALIGPPAWAAIVSIFLATIWSVTLTIKKICGWRNKKAGSEEIVFGLRSMCDEDNLNLKSPTNEINK
jgi:hypothetical protein